MKIFFPALFMVLSPLSGTFAAESSLTAEDLRNPQKALAKSATPLTLLGALLEAGEAGAAEEFLARLDPVRRADLHNKARSVYEFHQGNYAGALQALEIIESPDAWAQTQKRYLQGLMAVQADFVETRSEHFSLRASSRDAFLAQYALPALESAYDKAAEAYGVRPSTPVLVEIYPDEESFSYASTLPKEALERSGAVGICKFRRLMILSPRATPLGYRWLDALAHEYGHHWINGLSGGLCPLWLHEGLARSWETAWRRDGPFEHSPDSANRLAEAALVNPTTGALLIPFQRMEPSLVNLKNQDEVSLAFAQVSDAAVYLADQFGADKVKELLQNFRALPRDKAFEESLGLSEAEVEDSWKASLAGRPWALAKGAMGQRISFKPVDELRFVGAGAQGHLRLGDRLRQEGQGAAALLQYEKSLALEPDNGVALVKAARLLVATDGTARAEELLRRAAAKNPSYVTPFALLGDILFEDGRYEEAQRFLQEGLEINPFHPGLHETLGLIALDVGNFPSARQSLGLALELDPSNGSVRDALRNMPKGSR